MHTTNRSNTRVLVRFEENLDMSSCFIDYVGRRCATGGDLILAGGYWHADWMDSFPSADLVFINVVDKMAAIVYLYSI